MNSELIKYLSRFLSEKRMKVFEEVLQMRTRYITVVLEDLYQAQNASAVLRTCDCFGIQDVHVIENRNKFTIHKDISLGSNKWLSLFHYKKKKHNTLNAISHLREQNYRIVATSPDKAHPGIHELDLSRGKVALLFGTELTGISDVAGENADEYIHIPMYGFTESFNISVSVALCLYDIIHRLHNSEINWKLSPEEYSDILLRWLRFSIKKAELIEKKFISGSCP